MAFRYWDYYDDSKSTSLDCEAIRLPRAYPPGERYVYHLNLDGESIFVIRPIIHGMLGRTHPMSDDDQWAAVQAMVKALNGITGPLADHIQEAGNEPRETINE